MHRPAEKQKPKIFIVGEDKTGIEGARQILESRNYAVTAALDRITGLAKIRSEKPDLIILDSEAAGAKSSGRHLPEEIREEPAIAYIPILMVNSVKGAVRTGLQVDARIPTPAVPEALLRKVDRLLGMRSSRWAARFSE